MTARFKRPFRLNLIARRARADDVTRFDRILRTTRWVELIGVFVSATAAVALEYLTHQRPGEPIALTSGVDNLNYPWIVMVCAAMAAYNLFAEWTGRRHLLTRATLPGITMDLVFVTGIVARTGGLQSLYYGLYYLVVIGAAIGYGWRGALYTALASTACLFSVEAGEVIGGHQPSPLVILATLGAPEVFSRLPYLYLVAWLSGTVTEAFQRETDRRVALEREALRLQAEQDAVTRDMEAARQVQQSLMPSAPPDAAGLQVAVRYLPIGPVGGDMYDYIRLSPTEVGFVMADVSGHSLPAALLVAAAKGALYDAVTLPPERLMARVNRNLIRHSGTEQFVTMVYVRVDPLRREMHWVNAGHPMPIRLRAGQPPEVMSGAGVVLGVVEQARYAERSAPVLPGDVLLLYSDGMMEREAPSGRVTGFTDFVASLDDVRADQDAEAIAEDVLARAAGLGEARDDSAVMVIRFTENEAPAEGGIQARDAVLAT